MYLLKSNQTILFPDKPVNLPANEVVEAMQGIMLSLRNEGKTIKAEKGGKEC